MSGSFFSPGGGTTLTDGYSAIACAFDAAALAGQPFKRGVHDVTIPVAASQVDGGRYVDALSFLCGYGAQRSIDADLTGEWQAASLAGGGTMVMGIDSDDRVYIHTSVAEQFEVHPSSSDPWGWGQDVVSVAHGSGHRATATRPWTRGPLSVQLLTSQFLVVCSLGSFAAPVVTGIHHSLPTFMRYQANDVDDTTTACLAAWDNNATDNLSRRVNWGVDGEGRVFSSWSSSVSDLSWNANGAAVALRTALGFTGTEAVASSGGHHTLTATYQLPGLMLIRRGFSRYDDQVVSDAVTQQMMDGQAPGRTWWSATEYLLSFGLRGIMATVDEASHAKYTCLSRLARGQRCTLFGRWGDPRRARTVPELFAGAPVDLASKSHVAALGGLDGRRMCRVSPSSPDVQMLAHQANVARLRTEDLSLVLREI